MSKTTTTKPLGLIEAHAAAVERAHEAEQANSAAEAAVASAEEAEDELRVRAQRDPNVTASDLIAAAAEVDLTKLRAKGSSMALAAAQKALPASPHVALAIADALNVAELGVTFEAVATFPSAPTGRGMKGYVKPGRGMNEKPSPGGATLNADADVIVFTTGALTLNTEALSLAVNASKSLERVIVDEHGTTDGGASYRYKIKAEVSWPELPTLRGLGEFVTGVRLHELPTSVSESARTRHVEAWSTFVETGRPQRTETQGEDGVWTVEQIEERQLQIIPQQADGWPGRTLSDARRIIEAAVEAETGYAQSGLGRVQSCELHWLEGGTKARIRTVCRYARG